MGNVPTVSPSMPSTFKPLPKVKTPTFTPGFDFKSGPKLRSTQSKFDARNFGDLFIQAPVEGQTSKLGSSKSGEDTPQLAVTQPSSSQSMPPSAPRLSSAGTLPTPPFAFGGQLPQSNAALPGSELSRQTPPSAPKPSSAGALPTQSSFTFGGQFPLPAFTVPTQMQTETPTAGSEE
jgi:hypothetical protein